MSYEEEDDALYSDFYIALYSGFYRVIVLALTFEIFAFFLFVRALGAQHKAFLLIRRLPLFEQVYLEFPF